MPRRLESETVDEMRALRAKGVKARAIASMFGVSPECVSRYTATQSTLKHGLSYTAEYRVWQTMRLRCHDPNNRAYADYGGRGIRVCDRWRNSVENFLADMGTKPSAAHEIDRVDNDKGYDPTNCRWVTRTESCRNRRSNVCLEYRGVRQTMIAWSEQTRVPYRLLKKRIAAGWTVEKAIETPCRYKAPDGSARR